MRDNELVPLGLLRGEPTFTFVVVGHRMSADSSQFPFTFDRPPVPPRKRGRRWLGPALVAIGTLALGLVIGTAAGRSGPAAADASATRTTVTVTQQPKALAAVTATRQATPQTRTRTAAAKTVVREKTVRVPTTVAVTKAVTRQVTATVEHERTVERVVRTTVTAKADAPQQLADSAGPAGPQPPMGSSCPADAPIKGNANSGIYHVPGGEYYDRTIPEECFATEADAVAAGYRASKR